jgi:hypothetical protein
MSNAPTVLKGTVHGRIIQLEDEPGLPDGQSVTVTLLPASQKGISDETPPRPASRPRWWAAGGFASASGRSRRRNRSGTVIWKFHEQLHPSAK